MPHPNRHAAINPLEQQQGTWSTGDDTSGSGSKRRPIYADAAASPAISPPFSPFNVATATGVVRRAVENVSITSLENLHSLDGAADIFSAHLRTVSSVGDSPIGPYARPPPLEATTDEATTTMKGRCSSCLRSVWDFVFYGAMLPTDDYVVTVRKASLGILLIANLIQVADIAAMWSYFPMTLNLYFLITVLLPLVVAGLSGFLFCRVQQSAPAWLLSTVLLTVMISRCFLAPTFRSIDVEPISFGYLMIAFCTRLPWAVEVAAFVLTVIALVLNTAMMKFPVVAEAWMVIDADRYLHGAVPPGSSGGWTSPMMAPPSLVHYLISMRLVFLLKSATVFFLARRCYRFLYSGAAMLQLSREVVERLHDYDTDGALDILQGGSRSGGDSNSSGSGSHVGGGNRSRLHHERLEEPREVDPWARVDPNLRRAFEGIVQNMRKYRPFLPNYLLGDATTAQAAAAGAGTTTSFNGPQIVVVGPLQNDRLQQSHRPLLPPLVLSTICGSTDDALSSQPSHKPPSNNNSGGKPPSFGTAVAATGVGYSPDTSLVPVAVHSPMMRLVERRRQLSYGDSLSDRRFTVGGAASGGGEPSLTGIGTGKLDAPLRSPLPLLSNVTRVSVCIIAVERNAAARIEFGTASLWSMLIGAVNDVAHATGASLHSFHGDRLVATWNGTKRITKPETRACQFAIRIRGTVASHPTLKAAFAVSAMIGTRHAECCFAGDSRLRLFACSSPELWRHVYAGLTRVERLHLAVTDRSTKEYAFCDISFRAAALLREPKRSTTTTVPPIMTTLHSNSTNNNNTNTNATTTTATSPDMILQRRCLYEVIQERLEDLNAEQEWMYALQHHAEDPNEQLTDAMELFALGKFVDCSNTLKALLPEHQQELLRFPAVAELWGEMVRGGPRAAGGDDDSGTTTTNSSSLLKTPMPQSLPLPVASGVAAALESNPNPQASRSAIDSSWGSA